MKIRQFRAWRYVRAGIGAGAVVMGVASVWGQRPQLGIIPDAPKPPAATGAETPAGPGAQGAATPAPTPAPVSTPAPASAPVAVAPAVPAPAAGEAAAKKPTVEELLSKEKAKFDFSEKPLNDVLAYVAQSYHVQVINKYEGQLAQKMTIKAPEPLSAREAIGTVNDALSVLGFTLVESVRGEPAQVTLTVVAARRDAGFIDVPVGYGNDPEKIPEGDSVRTQVFTLTNLDPAKAKETISSVLGSRADVTLNSSTHTMIITDTGTHLHMAAALIQVLERQATEVKSSPASK